MKNIFCFISAVFVCSTAFADSWYNHDCVHLGEEFYYAKNVSAQFGQQRFLKSASTIALNKNTNMDRSVESPHVTTHLKAITYPYSGTTFGAVVSLCDSDDQGQANCMDYVFRKLGEVPVLLSIVDNPHCCAPREIQFTCLKPYN